MNRSSLRWRFRYGSRLMVPRSHTPNRVHLGKWTRRNVQRLFPRLVVNLAGSFRLRGEKFGRTWGEYQYQSPQYCSKLLPVSLEKQSSRRACVILEATTRPDHLCGLTFVTPTPPAKTNIRTRLQTHDIHDLSEGHRAKVAFALKSIW